MDDASRTPPRFAQWVLDRALPHDERSDAMRGDLLEEFRRRGGSRFAAACWYSWHASSVAIRYARIRPGKERSMWIESTWQDMRYAVRSYLRAPTLTIAIVATLALGIGASTAIFSMVDGILLRPLPLPDPDRLVYVTEVNPKGQTISTSWPNYIDWRQRVTSFDGLALTRDEPLTLTRVDAARRIRARRVTGNFFNVLRVSPSLGRAMTEADDRGGAAPVIVVSDAFWRTQLGADPSAVGRILTLNDTAYTVIGVMPRGFEYLYAYDAFVSMAPMANNEGLRRRGNHNGYSAVGRLKPGVGLEAAAAEMRAIAAALEHEYPATNTGVGVVASRLADRLTTDIRGTLLALFGAVGCLLLMACTNVASLLIARGAARQHELAVRKALGGGRPRLVRQLLVESTLVCGAGGALGVVIAAVLITALVAGAPEGTPRIESVHLSRAAMIFACAASAVCGLFFGAVPALQGSDVNGQQALAGIRGGGASARSHRLRRGLIVVETALAIVLLTGAGLMIRTLQYLSGTDPGFRTDHLLTTRFTVSGDQAKEDVLPTLLDEITARVRAVPGVESAALTLSLPVEGSQWNSVFIVSGQPVPDRAHLKSAAFSPVGGGYFETMGIRLRRGRSLQPSDTAASRKVVVVNERLAREMWPGTEAVGKYLKQSWPEDPSPWREVVGVVGDVKLNGLIEDSPLQVYIPAAQDPSNSMAIVARTTIDPLAAAPAVEAAVRQVNKDMPLYTTRSMDQVLAASIAKQRMSVLILSTFALVALVIAAVGVYGVVAQSVTERTHEIGVRMALGAERRHVLVFVVRQGLTMTLAGIAAGLVTAAALSKTIESLLVGVPPTDPATFASVITVLFAVAAVASYVPAWRAARVDPTRALRAQ